MAATIDGGRRRSRIELSIVDYWALLMCLVMVFLAAFGSAIWGEAANEMRLDQALAPISSEHWMGTDQLGRDIFLRTLVATRASVASALAATVIGAILGIALGAFTALTRGVLKTALSGLIGILVAFPGTLIAIFFAVVFGLGSMASILAIATDWPNSD